jgi:hypothetical protein
MVRVAGFVAINQENNDDRRDEAQETLEAQEARVIDEYESALRGILDNDLERAEVPRLSFCSLFFSPFRGVIYLAVCCKFD